VPDPPPASASPNDATDPGAPPSAHDGAGSDTATTGTGDLLQGLRRDRPPPKLEPRVRAESEGEQAVAYYGGPKSVPTRFETPEPTAPVEIAITSHGAETVPSALRVAQMQRAHLPSTAVTVRVRPRTTRVRVVIWTASSLLVASALTLGMMIVRDLGARGHGIDARSASSATATPTQPKTDEATPPSSAANADPAQTATPTPPPTKTDDPTAPSNGATTEPPPATPSAPSSPLSPTAAPTAAPTASPTGTHPASPAPPRPGSASSHSRPSAASPPETARATPPPAPTTKHNRLIEEDRK
jgi:hypothetical protein